MNLVALLIAPIVVEHAGDPLWRYGVPLVAGTMLGLSIWQSKRRKIDFMVSAPAGVGSAAPVTATAAVVESAMATLPPPVETAAEHREELAEIEGEDDDLDEPVPARRAPAKTATRRPAAKKTAAKKTAAKKTTARKAPAKRSASKMTSSRTRKD